MLLAKVLNIELRRVGAGNRRTFTTAGEASLTEWMGEHARVSWVPHAQPWLLEEELIAALDLPLNLQGNSHNPFYPMMKRLRAEAEQNARDKPIIQQNMHYALDAMLTDNAMNGLAHLSDAAGDPAVTLTEARP